MSPARTRHVDAIGQDVLYWSESKKVYVPLEDMNFSHLRNAITKLSNDEHHDRALLAAMKDELASRPSKEEVSGNEAND